MRVLGGWRIWVLLGVGFVSCKRHTDANLQVARVADAPTAVAPAGTPLKDRALQGDAFRYRFAIYLPQKPQLDLNRELASAVAGSSLGVAAEVPKLDPAPRSTTVTLSQPNIDDFAPPKPESIEFRAPHLNADEKQRLMQSRFVAVFEVVGPGARALADYHQALTLAQTLATKLKGILWDEETRHAFTLQGWQSRLDSWQGDLPLATEHVTLDLYRDGELMRLVSLGMIKFGLPDLVVNQVSEGEARSMGNLMNLALQRMLERRALDAPGALHLSLDDISHAGAKKEFDTNILPNAQRKLDVTLVELQPAEGDADNRLLELQFPGAGTLQQKQASAIAAVWGSSDSIKHVEHDAKLLEASARARQKALGFQPRYAKGPPFGERLLVKAPFATPDEGTEWMWVEVVSWKGNRITGILDNEPFEIPTLKAGARVEVPADKIFDYILTRSDGTQEGNETGKLIEAAEGH